MKITMITPQIGRKPDLRYVRTWQMEPLTIATLAALTPPEIEIEYIDERLGETVDLDHDRDLVAITVETYTAKRAYELCEAFRARNTPVILGGYHVMLAPDEAARYADAILVGFAESLWPRILKDAEAGVLERRYVQDRSIPYAFAIPERRIFEDRDYFRLHCVETGRGCPLSCNFCSIAAGTGSTYRPRDVESIVEDIARLPHSQVFFVEDNFVGNPRHAKALLRALIPLGIRWVGQGTLNMAKDPELLELMRASGCAGVLIGFESLKRETLLAMGKPINVRMGPYDTLIRQLHRHNIALYGTFIFGYDTESIADIRDTTERAIDLGIFMAAFNHLLPFPGTPLYATLRREGRLIDDPWWLSPTFRFGNVPFRPQHLSPEELHEECLRARERFYSVSSIARRAFENREGNFHSLTKAGAYLWINSLLRREIAEKDGLPLGNSPHPPSPHERSRHEPIYLRRSSS